MAASEPVGRAIGRAAVWNGFGRTLVHVLEFAAAIVLARLLGTEEFGLIAMALVVMRFAEIVSELGISAALVYRARPDASDWASAFLLNVLTGGVMGLLTLTLAPLIGALFGREDLIPVVRLLALYFPLRATAFIAQAHFTRELRFAALVRAETTAVAIGASCAIAAALAGLGALAVAIQYIVVGGVTGLLLAPTSRQLMATGKVSLARAAELWRYARGLVGFSLVNYVSRNADDFLIGRYVGPGDLALYNRAYALMLLPVGQVVRVLDRVMFPALSREAGDRARFRSRYTQAIKIIALVAFPMLGIGAVASDDVVLLLLGAEWSQAAGLFRILAVAGVATVVSTTTGWLFQASGQTSLLFRWGLASTLVSVVAFVLGLPWGAHGVAVAYAIRAFLLLPFSIRVPGRLLEIRVRDVARALAPEFGVATVVIGVSWIAALGTHRVLGQPSVRLAVVAVCASVAFLAAVRVLRPSSLDDLIGLSQDLTGGGGRRRKERGGG